MVTLIPRLPLSAKCWAMELSNTRQSEPIIADATPSWLDLGIASQIKRRLFPFSSNLSRKIEKFQWTNIDIKKFKDILLTKVDKHKQWINLILMIFWANWYCLKEFWESPFNIREEIKKISIDIQKKDIKIPC